MQSNATSKKELHEQFVSHLSGTTLAENYYLISLPILLNMCFSFWTVNLWQLGCGDVSGNVWLHFVAVVVPYVVSITVLSDHVCQITALVATLALIGLGNSALLSKSSKYWPVAMRLTLHRPHIDAARLSRLFVSQMRGIVLVVSSICILAVDLPIFPRRFAKTETYGLGPMDLGVGLFTLLAGLVGGGPRRDNQRGGGNMGRPIAVLLLLGLARLLALPMVDYQQHASEYGRHWNFFFTLAAVSAFAVAMRGRSIVAVAATAVLMAGAHQWLLHGAPTQLEAVCMANWTTNDTANGTAISRLVSHNKQGIISLPGYTILWLIGALIGGLIHRRRASIIAIVVVAAVIIGIASNGPSAVSRRVANLPYIAWTSCSFIWCLVLLIIGDACTNWLQDRANYVTRTDYPDVYSAVNRHGLVHFVLANLITGLINISVNTMVLSPSVSLLVLFIYTAIPVAILQLVDRWQQSRCRSHQ